MNVFKSIDGHRLTRESSAINKPPGSLGGQVLGAASWIKVGDDWYRWEGLPSKCHESLLIAEISTLDEWLDCYSNSLSKWSGLGQ